MIDPDEIIEDADPAPKRGKAKKSAARILSEIKAAEKVLDPWQVKSDRIDKIYSSLQTLSGFMADRGGNLLDREYNLFWASVEVIKPSIYARAPVPVVVPRYEERDPVKRITSEMLERCATAGFDETDINSVMLGVRDDLVINARGVIWLSYETSEEASFGTEAVCIEHLDRRDFIHQPARKWAEVEWVGRHAWLSRTEARKRFNPHSGNLYQDANYGQHKDERGDDGTDRTVAKARFTEVWHKGDKKVYWVAEGCDGFLDQDDPHLKLKGYFPCPKPAYATLQRRSLVPVPDISYIQDQLETINELTVRIHDLCDKLVVKGIVPAGTDVGDAVEAAFREENASHMLIPVPSMSMSDGAGKLVEWLPIDVVAGTIISAVEARREIIGNVQELFGIADIMRGETEAQETATAQKLKSQYGSVRIRDKVGELVRIARDSVRIMVEIMAEEFDFDTLLDMSQMQIATQAEVTAQIKKLQDAAKKELSDLATKAEELLQSPEAQQNPQEAQQQFQQAQQAIIAKYSPQIEQLSQSVTQEAVKDLLDDEKVMPFSLDIETDSTIYPDEQAEKQARNEFMQVFTAAAANLAMLAQTGKQGAKLAVELLKFQLGPYRAGRQLEGVIDEWGESLQNMPAQPNPEAEAAKAEAEIKTQQLAIEGRKVDGELSLRERELGLKEQELGIKQAEIQQKPQTEAMKEQIKAQGNAQAKELDAQVAVAREQAQLNADKQTAQLSLDAEALLEQQRQQSEDTRFAIDDQFRREELAIDTDLEYAKLNQQAQQAQAALKKDTDGAV